MPWHGCGELLSASPRARNEASAAGRDRHQSGTVGAGFRQWPVGALAFGLAGPARAAGRQLRDGANGACTRTQVWEAGSEEQQPRYSQRADLKRKFSRAEAISAADQRVKQIAYDLSDYFSRNFGGTGWWRFSRLRGPVCG